MEPKLNIAVFVDYDNIEIGVKSTLRREFNVTLTLDALRERGDIVAKFAYANWGLQPRATRQMAENAVQMVQRNPSPRGDKNGGDINLALDALEMAFTHKHVNAFAIISGDSDFNPLVNKLKEYGKTVYIVGGKAFTSNILQQNCHEFISYESMIGDERKTDSRSKDSSSKDKRPRRRRASSLDLARAMPLVKRTLQVLERRNVQPQLGLLKSTMLQLDSRFSEKDYGASSFSELIDKLKEAGYVKLSGSGGQATIETKTSEEPEKALVSPEEALPPLRDVLESHRLEIEEGCPADQVEAWIAEDAPDFAWDSYGFPEFAQLLNFAQDKLVVRVEPDEEAGLLVYLGEEFYPTAAPEPAAETKPRRRASRRRSSRTTLPGEKIASALPDEKYASALPDDRRSSELPGERKTSRSPRGRQTSALPGEKIAVAMSDEKESSELPGEKKTSRSSRGRKASALPGEKIVAAMPDEKESSEAPGEKKATRAPRARKSAALPGEKKAPVRRARRKKAAPKE